MANLGADALKNTLTNPARPYLWEVLISAPKGGGSQTDLFFRCQSASIPGRSFSTINVPYKGSAGVNFAGKEAYPQKETLTFVEGTDKKIITAIYGWFQYIRDNRTGTGNPDSAYKSDMYVNLLAQDGSTTSKFRIIGAFPSDMPDIALSYAEGTSMLNISVTFTYDRWELAD